MTSGLGRSIRQGSSGVGRRSDRAALDLLLIRPWRHTPQPCDVTREVRLVAEADVQAGARDRPPRAEQPARTREANSNLVAMGRLAVVPVEAVNEVSGAESRQVNQLADRNRVGIMLHDVVSDPAQLMTRSWRRESAGGLDVAVQQLLETQGQACLPLERRAHNRRFAGPPCDE